MPAASPQQKETAAAGEDATASPADQSGQTAIPRVEGSQTKECDVCVVGAGAAGLMAALKLAEAGKKVIVVEKAPSAAMSNFAMCGGPAACETKLQEQEGETVTLDTLFGYMYDFSRASVNGALLRNCLAGTSDALNAMIDLGMPMSLWPDVYGNGFRARHYLESEGEERVAPARGGHRSRGRRVFVQHGRREGHRRGRRGARRCRPTRAWTCWRRTWWCARAASWAARTCRCRCSTRRCSRWATRFPTARASRWCSTRAERSTATSPCWATNAARWRRPRTGSPFTEDWHNVNEHYGYWLFGGLYTDTAGERFINEEEIAQFPLAIGGEALLRAGKAYVVMDSEYYEAVKNEGIYAYLGQPESWVSGPEADYYKTTPENAEAHLQQAIDEGWALKADTVAELAEKFSLDALEATVERYNGFCDAGGTATSARARRSSSR